MQCSQRRINKNPQQDEAQIIWQNEVYFLLVYGLWIQTELTSDASFPAYYYAIIKLCWASGPSLELINDVLGMLG